MDAHSFALSLPEATEADHHGMASYRVRGKIFATVPDSDHIRVMVGEDEIRAAVAQDPAHCTEVYWGAKLSCVAVAHADVEPELLTGLLTEAWLRKAPKTLAASYLQQR